MNLCRPASVVVFVIVVLSCSHSDSVFSHGSIISPESRIHKCRFGENGENIVESPTDPACAAAITLGGTQAIYDWNAVRQGNANSRHQDIIPDGELCGGGNPTFVGMNLPRSDWETSPIESDANGDYEFIYYGTAPHATKEWIFYVTNDQWQSGTPLTWGNIEEFCRLGGVPLEIDEQGKKIYRLKCRLPEKSGTHIIYNIWQRSDSEEAFYSCSDVRFADRPQAPSSDAIMVPMYDLLFDDEEVQIE